jgi:ADP-ribosylglycohydrolase
MMNVREQVRGAVYGFAFGDAWGNVTEFMGYEEILEKQHTTPRKTCHH